MSGRRFLLLHVTTSSGHHHASLAIAQGLRQLDPTCQIMNVDAFDYTTRFIKSAIMRSYMSIIRHQPDVWEYLYDNPTIHKRVQHFRGLLHHYHGRKLQRLLETAQPHAIACTQAFPCGMVADFKKHRALQIPLVGVLTDFAPHLYWMHETINTYVVAGDELRDRFVANGIEAERVRVFGIPVPPRAIQPADLERVAGQFGVDRNRPMILVMGGGSGFGPLRELMLSLDRVPMPCQFVVLGGTNHALVHWLRQQSFRQPITVHSYVDTVPELMRLATLIITKPGGLTTSEALAFGTPLLMVSPIPGQEMCNARYLLSHEAALLLEHPHLAHEVVTQLLEQPERLAALKTRMKRLAHPNAGLDIAQHMITLADAFRNGPAAPAHAPTGATAA
ncbi:MAG: hypothetical protein HYY15_02685 [Candidatus Omnitrophica bacterium]|nr:hypothetical protein [Candidatus Omnitrophota bacterium]